MTNTKNVTVAATQMACLWDIESNITRAESLVRQAASAGAEIILIQELYETPYFCIEQDFRHLELASTLEDSEGVRRMSALAKELSVVLPVSWFERAGSVFFNSVAVIDADGTVMGTYRKTHLPNAIGYQEKQYFSPGDTGFQVWNTRYAKIGVGICWDQWFPEAARCMALQGAEMLLYPTAIGSEPGDQTVDSMPHWQNVMCGHAAANIMPVIASNRIGVETTTNGDMEMTFYGSSFISDELGNKVQIANRTEQDVLTHTFDLASIQYHRETWGVYRDRRPDQYLALATMDGQVS
ncbi:MAG: N-carbamoylputrescine amidase [Gammaproteobacteria bacterium]|nr:N-carbamoylputrescine amidase [Gammaproteobacteria bacterium]